MRLHAGERGRYVAGVLVSGVVVRVGMGKDLEKLGATAVVVSMQLATAVRRQESRWYIGLILVIHGAPESVPFFFSSRTPFFSFPVLSRLLPQVHAINLTNLTTYQQS